MPPIDRSHDFRSTITGGLSAYDEEDARQKAERAVQLLRMEEHADDVVRMECYTQAEREVFERVFREIVPVHLMIRVTFTNRF